MTRCLKALAFLLLACPVLATDFFVDNHATGANNGNSWSNAWTDFNQIHFAFQVAGDTIWLSGGPDGTTNNYFRSLDDRFGVGSPNTGVFGNPITIRTGNDALHGGCVKIFGGVFLSRSFWLLDTRKSTNAVPQTILDTWNTVTTNCNLDVSCTNVGSAVQMFGTGSKCYGVHVSRMTSRDDTAIVNTDAGGRPIGQGSEIAYCWISSGNGYALRSEGYQVIADTFGQLSVHHNVVENVNDNFFQYPGHVDVYKNVCRNHVDPDVGHPDCIQEVNVYSRVWANFFYNFKGARFYVEANDPLSHDILAWNNVWYSDTNWYGNWYTNVANGNLITNNPGTGFDITGHDANPGTPCDVSNVFFFNNTTYLRATPQGTPAAFIWSSGSTANPRTSMQARSIWFMNNAIVLVPPFNNLCALQFPTNLTLHNSSTGFGYGSNDVHVDYNVVIRATGKGQGIVYGDGGNPDLSNQFTNMLDFASRTPYTHNSNTLAVFAALPDNRPYTRLPTADFMVGSGDTALVGTGTNLTALLAAIAPECTNDIFGYPRGSVWDVGAMQHVQDNSTWYVATTTNASDAYTPTQAHSPTTPWRTLNHAENFKTFSGSTVLVGPGDYNEALNLQFQGHDPINRSIFKGLPANDQLFPVTTRSVRVLAQYNNLEGFTVTKANGANGAMIRIEPPSSGGNNGSDCIITNNTIRDSVHLITTNEYFGINYVQLTGPTMEGANWTNAGFVVGMQVGFGADSLHVYTNHGQFLTVSNISPDALTIFFNTNLLPDLGSNYFANFLYGQANAASSFGIVSPKSSGGFPSATNVVITGNTISNVMAGVSLADGNNTVFTHNVLNALHGGPGLQFYTPNSTYAYNTILRNPNIEWFTAGELSSTNLHPGGGAYYDWQCNLITMGNAGISNIVWFRNWVQDSDTGLQTLDWATNMYGLLFSSNVWVGVQGGGSFNAEGVTLDHNLFYRAAFNFPQTTPVAFGSHKSLDMKITLNGFVDNGSHQTLANEVPYGVVPGNYTNITVGTNYAVTFEMNNWSNSAATVYTNGDGTITNGILLAAGDPVFINASNPLGPDGLAFTEDDGLRPLPNSKLALFGIGPLAPWPTNVGPLAHFTIHLPAPGYQDLTGTNFDPVWVGRLPDQRGNNIKPWAMPEAMGSNVIVVLDASQSLDGNGLSNTAITNYLWQINTTNTISTNSPFVSFNFNRPGTNIVSLTVTANGSAMTFINPYRVLGAVGQQDPDFTLQPVSQLIYAGQNATFTVATVGTAVIHYFWKFNGVAVGTDSASFTTNSVLIGANGGAVSVVISNSIGQLTSSTATLSVTPDPHITIQPQAQVVTPGNTAIFTVTADGATALSYLWQVSFNGGFTWASTGVTTQVLNVLNCQPPDSGELYRVEITDANGVLDSNGALLTVVGGVPALWTTGQGTAGVPSR